MATPKFTQVTVRVPTFLLSRWFRWSCLAAALVIVLWRVASALPFMQPEPEFGNVFTGGMGEVGKILPCGHPAVNAILSDSAVYACGHGHRFRSFGSWFLPLP